MNEKIQADQAQDQTQVNTVHKKQKAPKKKMGQERSYSSGIGNQSIAPSGLPNGYTPYSSPQSKQGVIQSKQTREGNDPKNKADITAIKAARQARNEGIKNSTILTNEALSYEEIAAHMPSKGERLPADYMGQEYNLLDNNEPVNISESVGKNAVNRPSDVKVIQRLLKKKFEYIKVTGICDSSTIRAIEDFQKSTFGGWSDGKVEPNRTTWSRLILLRNLQRHNNKLPTNPTLLNAVGNGQRNVATDVTTVQQLLNHHGASLVVNGICDKVTIKAIEAFQMQHFAFRDGIISVGGRTWRKLSEGIVNTKKTSLKTKASPYKDTKLTGAPILYVFLEDYNKNDYDYDKINKDSGAWDYVMDKNFHSIIEKLKAKYGSKQGFITDMVIRSHGYCAFGTQHGPIISGSVLSNLKNLWDTRVKDMMYLRSLLTGKAKVLFTACSIVQAQGAAQNNVIKDFGEFFLKGTDRSLFLNRTKSSSRGYVDENENGQYDVGKEKEYINFDTNLIKPDKKQDGTYKKLWAGYLWLKYNKKNNSITWKDKYYNVELDTETTLLNRLGSGPSEGIAPEEMSNLPVKIKAKKNYYGLD